MCGCVYNVCVSVWLCVQCVIVVCECVVCEYVCVCVCGGGVVCTMCV